MDYLLEGIKYGSKKPAKEMRFYPICAFLHTLRVNRVKSRALKDSGKCPDPKSSNQSKSLDDGLVQFFKERFKRIFSDALADWVVGDGDGAFEISQGVVGEHRATRLVLDANLAGRID